jgi:hypothetical protein
MRFFETMKTKKILCLAFVLTGVLFGCASNKPSVRLESCHSPRNFKKIYADSNYQFGSMRHDTQADVLVFSQRRQQWKRITEVSLADAKLGESPRLASINMDLAYVYKGRDYAPLPLHDTTGHYDILPDKIEFDSNRKTYLIYFNSNWRDVSVSTESAAQRITTKLEIQKKDLDAAFKTK